MKAPNDSSATYDDAQPLGVCQYFARNLRPGCHLRAVNLSGRHSHVHLRQGELDGACGPYCLLMAFTILGIAPQRQITQLSQLTSGKLVEHWRMLAALFFTGASSSDLVASLKKAPDIGVAHKIFKGGRTGIANFCVEQINNDAVVILGTKSAKKSFGHWTLVVGWEGYYDASARADTAHATPQGIRALLCLDPSYSEPVLTAYNTRIDVEPSARWLERYQVATTQMSTDRVSFDAAIAIRRIDSQD